MAIEGQAGAHIIDAVASENVAAKDGGFLYGKSARTLLLQGIKIEKNVATRGGGGGCAVFSSPLALEHVYISLCKAGARGGGGILLDEGAEAHFFGVEMDENESAESGGHLIVAASKAIFHGEEATLSWPSVEPIFDTPVLLGNPEYALFAEDGEIDGAKGCNSHPGFEDIKTANKIILLILPYTYLISTGNYPDFLINWKGVLKAYEESSGIPVIIGKRR